MPPYRPRPSKRCAVPRNESNSRVLRQIAKDAVEKVAAAVPIPDSDRGDLVTSLVRQWQTYDGRATFFLGGRQVELALGRTPLGKTHVRTQSVDPQFMRLLRRDYKIRLDETPDIAGQLNRAQSADVINPDGIALRLWVNPKDQKAGVERVCPDAARKEAPPPPNYLKMAAGLLDEHLGEGIDADEMAELATSVVVQWERFDGQAWVVLDAGRLLVLTVNLKSDGLYHLNARRVNIDLERALAAFGVAAEDVPEIITRLNRAQAFEYRDADGLRQRIWHDPKARTFWVQQIDAVRRHPRPVSPPVLCPECSAVLEPWADGCGQQTCRICKHTVARD
jgi:hypothetical protein